jgi:hypothetical protein
MPNFLGSVLGFRDKSNRSRLEFSLLFNVNAADGGMINRGNNSEAPDTRNQCPHPACIFVKRDVDTPNADWSKIATLNGILRQS